MTEEFNPDWACKPSCVASDVLKERIAYRTVNEQLLTTLLDYLQASQYWQIEPHDQKERNAYTQKVEKLVKKDVES